MKQYFALLSHLLEVYPEMLLELNAESFSHIRETLKFGLRHQVNALSIHQVYIPYAHVHLVVLNGSV